ncbi:O-antigen ligase family protein [Flaviaesturariibacter amylovorans]|uniref:O-antigen ligase-related domain-containing protein n=1 Tax=Flaviaesturariibacter amylovorans TaxID=1084520 RepID=A0ABP8GRR6_9BACT
MNFVTSKPVSFLLGKLQLILFIFPLTSLVMAFPGLAPVEKLANVLSFVGIVGSLAYVLFSDQIQVSLRGAFPLFLFLAFLALSTIWVLPAMKSHSSHVTMRTIFTVLQAFVIVNILGREELFKTLKGIAIVTALANLAFIFLFPSKAAWFMDDASRTQGMFSSPNNMGQFLAFAFIVVNFVNRKALSTHVWLGLNAAIVFQLFKCDSMTSLTGCILVSICYQFKFLLRPLFLVIIAAGLIVPHLNAILGPSTASIGINNRDMTFTGRTDVWEIMMMDLKARDRLTTGFGSGGYWLPGEGYNPYSTISELEWSPGQGHNGYMDVMVNTGIVGLVLVLIFLAWMIGSLFRRVDYSEPVVYLLSLILLLNNITEASLFREKHLYFVLLMLVFWYLFLDRAAQSARASARLVPGGNLQVQGA